MSFLLGFLIYFSVCVLISGLVYMAFFKSSKRAYLLVFLGFFAKLVVGYLAVLTAFEKFDLDQVSFVLGAALSLGFYSVFLLVLRARWYRLS